MQNRSAKAPAEPRAVLHASPCWDALVRTYPRPSLLQSHAWGRFKSHGGWVPARLEVQGVATAQVLFRRVPCTPFTLGYIPRGPLLEYADERALDLAIRALDRLARRYRAIAVTWEPPVPEGSALRSHLLARRFVPAPPIQARSTRLIDLSRGLDAAAAAQHPKWRYNTRLARKKGVTVRAAADLDDLARWYAVMQTTAGRDRFGIHDEAYYRRWWLETAADGDTALLLAEHDGRLLAGIMIHHFAGTATYLYGASSDEGRHLMPNHLLQWEAMRWAVDRGAAIYDLFGIADSDDPDDPLAGVTRFKAGWGGEVVRYVGAFDRIYRPLLHAAAGRVRGRVAHGMSATNTPPPLPHAAVYTLLPHGRR